MSVASGKGKKKVVSRSALYSLKRSNIITLGRDALLLCRECMVKSRPRPDRLTTIRGRRRRYCRLKPPPKQVRPLRGPAMFATIPAKYPLGRYEGAG